MRKLLIFLFTLVSLDSFSQTLSYKGDVNLNATKEQLSERASLWLAANASEVTNVSGIHTGKSSITYNSSIFYGSLGTKGAITYKVIIIPNDKGYSYELTQYRHEGNANNEFDLSFGELTIDEECPYHLKGQRKRWENKVWHELKDVANKDAEKTISSIKNAMSKK